ncbi:MAG: hypothetical protein PF637_05915 [Spirochaetes bacterium]|jgi:hypothetical protein|nr:hypothetical protein [Spirochaetota bacterium]
MNPEQLVIKHVKTSGLEIEDIYKKMKQICRKSNQVQINTEEMVYLYVFERLIYNIDNRYQRGIDAKLNREQSMKEFRIILSGGKICYENEIVPEAVYNQEKYSEGQSTDDLTKQIFKTNRVMGVLI